MNSILYSDIKFLRIGFFNFIFFVWECKKFIKLNNFVFYNISTTVRKMKKLHKYLYGFVMTELKNKEKTNAISKSKPSTLMNIIIKSAIIIQRQWRKYLLDRYKRLGISNFDDCDPISLKEIRLTPKYDLYLWTDQSNRIRAGNIYEFLKWIATFSFDQVPTHYYTRYKITESEMEWLINYARWIINKKKMTPTERKYWIDLIDYVEIIDLDRKNPDRVFQRIKIRKETVIGQLYNIYSSSFLSHSLEWNQFVDYLRAEKKSSVDLNVLDHINKLSLKDLLDIEEKWKIFSELEKTIQNFIEKFS